jgi:hypothetical protein
MKNDYNMVNSLSEEEFRKRSKPKALKDINKFTQSDASDIDKIEALLDVRPGVLRGDQFFLERIDCKGCGRTLTIYDFVFSGLTDAGHNKSFILHTLVGNKFVINTARVIRCSACATLTTKAALYHMPTYDCDAQAELL